jgi:16S rRNA C967 or C1407 C5-methylase (RsmB/RsmF family)/NOL1/NOP2/fmu family ribosome biogenesis protein
VLFPPGFIQSIQHCTGFNEPGFEAVHQSGEQVTAIRVNAAKTNAGILQQHLPFLQKVPWSGQGYYLQQRPSFITDPLFHAGAYYVQDASSMFVEQALLQTTDVTQPLHVLDLCAAPGGKSTLLQSLIHPQSLLVSNEVIKPRAAILAENMSKWGAANVIVTNNDPRDFQRLPGFFDVIVVDAPCSGSGLFRKDMDAVNEWSLQNVALCSQRQQRILADVLPALKQGGTLIYATCSYSAEEDEAITDWLVETQQMQGITLSVPTGWGIVTTASPVHNASGYRFYPDQVRGEGFFIAAFKKIEGLQQYQHGKQKNKIEKLTSKQISSLNAWVANTTAHIFIQQQDWVLAFPKPLEQQLLAIQNNLYIKKAGINTGTLVREALIPGHELAISNIINNGVAAITVDKDTALQYLRKQDIVPHTTAKGWALVKYNQLALGWIKILANRANNYYPKEWRILHK